MQFEGAVIKEQGVTFAVIAVKSHVVGSNFECDRVRHSFGSIFPGIPIVLVGSNSVGKIIYQGRPDIVRFLSNIDPSRIPWKKYNYS